MLGKFHVRTVFSCFLWHHSCFGRLLPNSNWYYSDKNCGLFIHFFQSFFALDISQVLSSSCNNALEMSCVLFRLSYIILRLFCTALYLHSIILLKNVATIQRISCYLGGLTIPFLDASTCLCRCYLLKYGYNIYSLIHWYVLNL